MILHVILFVVAISSSLTTTVFAGCDRGNRLIAEGGGAAGIEGIAGPEGTSAIPGAPGILDFSDFYALMPGDNTATIAADAPVLFPQDGATSGVITRLDASSFLLPAIGAYTVSFQASVAEAGQLMLRLNGSILPDSVVGRATGTSQIVGMSIVQTTTPNSVLEVINPPGNATALTLTPVAGGTHAVSAHLVIVRIQ